MSLVGLTRRAMAAGLVAGTSAVYLLAGACNELHTIDLTSAESNDAAGGSDDGGFDANGGEDSGLGSGGSGSVPGPTCGDDDDCTFHQPYCTSSGCAECRSSEDCGGSRPYCMLGECVECDSNRDCSHDTSCRPDLYVCALPCGDAAACDGSDTPFCDERVGFCVECLDSSPCPSSAPVCDPVNSICVDCLRDSDCVEPKPFCDVARRDCIECWEASDCPDSRPVCDPRDGDCVECIVDSDCESGASCGSGECQQ